MGDTIELAQRIEGYLRGRGEVTEGRVLAGRGFFLDGHLVAAAMDEDLCVHVGKEEWQSVLSAAGVRPLLFADLPVPGWVMVTSATIATDDALAGWIEHGSAG